MPRNARFALLALTLSGCGSTPTLSLAPRASVGRAAVPTAAAAANAIVECPDEASWLASLPPLEQRAREGLGMHCVAGPGGRWELQLTDLASGPLSEEADGGTGERITGRFALAFVDASGTARLGASRAFEHRNAEDWWSADHVEPRGRFDLDGDGLEELFVWIGRAEHEATPRGELIALTVREGAVTEYAPARVGVPIDEVEDVDGDGRPDLVSFAPYGGSSPWGADAVPAGGPRHVFRSLADGSFSDQDEVVLAQLRHDCPTRPERFLAQRPSEEGYVEAITAVSCARIHGVSTEEIVRTLLAEQAAGVCTDEGWADCGHLVEELQRHAALTPAHRLP